MSNWSHFRAPTRRPDLIKVYVGKGERALLFCLDENCKVSVQSDWETHRCDYVVGMVNECSGVHFKTKHFKRWVQVGLIVPVQQ